MRRSTLDSFVCDFAGDGFALEDFGVEIKLVQRVTGGEVSSLRGGAEEDAEKGEDANGRYQEGKEAAVRGAGLGRHVGKRERIIFEGRRESCAWRTPCSAILRTSSLCSALGEVVDMYETGTLFRLCPLEVQLKLCTLMQSGTRITPCIRSLPVSAITQCQPDIGRYRVFYIRNLTAFTNLLCFQFLIICIHHGFPSAAYRYHRSTFPSPRPQ